jgi:hypothetical protein
VQNTTTSLPTGWKKICVRQTLVLKMLKLYEALMVATVGCSMRLSLAGP